MSSGVWFGSLLIPQSRFGARLERTNHLRASQLDFPLASKIIVRNLSYSTTEGSLQKEFLNFGQIAEVKLVMDEETKRPKGYAFIQYTCQDDAMLALESMDYEYFDGRIISVELAKPVRNLFGRYPRTTGPPRQQNNIKDVKTYENNSSSLS